MKLLQSLANEKLNIHLLDHLSNCARKEKPGVATMTPEIGIDIEDIDAIVLAEVPWRVSSLLQRIGRGQSAQMWVPYLILKKRRLCLRLWSLVRRVI